MSNCFSCLHFQCLAAIIMHIHDTRFRGGSATWWAGRSWACIVSGPYPKQGIYDVDGGMGRDASQHIAGQVKWW